MLYKFMAKLDFSYAVVHAAGTSATLQLVPGSKNNAEAIVSVLAYGPFCLH